MSKNTVETDGPQMTSQRGAYALYAGLASLHARMRMRTHPQRPLNNTYCFSAARMIRERASVLRHTYIAPRVLAYFLKNSFFRVTTSCNLE